VVEALLAHDYDVVAVSRSGIKAQILLGAFADRISIMTPDDLYDLPKGITAVLNLAYMKDEKSHAAVAAARKAA
jgi:uncharacterized protein YbjT (DUF2867 family)